MALTTSYLITTKNVDAFFNSLISARAPEIFTIKFLTGLEFTSTNDRLFIGLLKSLGFLEENGAPTQRYYDFMDQSRSKEVMAEAVMDAYEDLFNVNVEAYKLSDDDVKNKLKTLTQGKHSDKVYRLMANTFKALSDYATWDTKKPPITKTAVSSDTRAESSPPKHDEDISREPTFSPRNVNLGDLGLHYNIQIHLPESRDSAVYDALFKSLKDHLL